MPPDLQKQFSVFISWNMSHLSHTHTNDCHVSSPLTRANLAPNHVDDNGAKSQVATTMTESHFLVEATVRGHHVYKDIFWPGLFYFQRCKSIVKICIQRRCPAISYACVCLPIIYLHIYAKLNGIQSTSNPEIN